jgi:hypothetical protein
MKSYWWRMVAGVLLMAAGALLLLVEFERITLEGPIWGPLFLLGGAAFFLILWLSDRSDWWPVIPGGVMFAWGVSTLLGNLGVAGWFVALIGMAGSALPFLYIFARNRRSNWWALIPGGIMLLVGLATALGELLGGDWVATFVLWGIALAFALVFAADRRNWWALIPAGVMALIGFSVSPVVASVSLLFGLALIVFGVIVILRILARQF